METHEDLKKAAEKMKHEATDHFEDFKKNGEKKIEEMKKAGEKFFKDFDREKFDQVKDEIIDVAQRLLSAYLSYKEMALREKDIKLQKQINVDGAAKRHAAYTQAMESYFNERQSIIGIYKQAIEKALASDNNELAQTAMQALGSFVSCTKGMPSMDQGMNFHDMVGGIKKTPKEKDVENRHDSMQDRNEEGNDQA